LRERRRANYQGGDEEQQGSAHEVKQASTHCMLPDGRVPLMGVIGCHEALASRIRPWHFIWSAFETKVTELPQRGRKHSNSGSPQSGTNGTMLAQNM
jgi:hypothetical protein